MYGEYSEIVLIVGGLIGLVLILAQLKLFSIDAKLEKIVKILEKKEADKGASDS